MPLQTMIPRRLYRQVAEQLRQLIDSGEYPVGGRLPTERELAVQLGISRPTVREALIALEVDGRIQIRVGSGIYVLPAPKITAGPAAVSELPAAGPFDILAARALFEGAIAEQVARLATPDDIAPIDDILRTMRSASGACAVEADRAFHLAIATVLGNEAVSKVVGDLFDQRINPYFARLASYFETATSWRAAFDEHVAIRDMIVAADPDGARTAMTSHLRASQERFSRTFGERSEPIKARSAAKVVARSKPLNRILTPRRKHL